MASQPGPQTRAPPPASQTQTLTAPQQPRAAAPTPILRLRGAHTSRQRVQWTEDVVDNEKLNRKKSKVCCIYHRPKAVGESSDESSSSSDSETDSDDGGGRDRKDQHGDDCPGHGKTGRDGRSRRRRDREARRPSPNAYERMPKVRARPTPQSGGGDAGESGSKSKA